MYIIWNKFRWNNARLLKIRQHLTRIQALLQLSLSSKQVISDEHFGQNRKHRTASATFREILTKCSFSCCHDCCCSLPKGGMLLIALGMSRRVTDHELGTEGAPSDRAPPRREELGGGVWYWNRLQWPKVREWESVRLISKLAVAAPMRNQRMRLGAR